MLAYILSKRSEHVYISTYVCTFPVPTKWNWIYSVEVQILFEWPVPSYRCAAVMEAFRRICMQSSVFTERAVI